MEAKACAKYIRIAPRKSRLVIDMIRGKSAAEAATILAFSTRAASKAVLKVLNSAVANAVQKGTANLETLIVAEAYADEGPTLKRWRPRARGRASRINKRSSHITIVLTGEDKKKPAKAEAKEAPKKEAKKTAVEKPVKKEKATKKTTPAKKSEAATAKKTGTEEKQVSSPSSAKATEDKKEGLSGSEG